MCACNSHSLENRRLLWPTLDLKSSTVIVLLSHFHFHWGAASKQPRTRACGALHWRGAAADQRHHCRGRAQLCGLWAGLRPADLAVSAERPMLFFEAVGGRSPYHCTVLGLLVYWLTACLFRCRKAKKKWEHFHVKRLKTYKRLTELFFDTFVWKDLISF